jgi:hypothetical protein
MVNGILQSAVVDAMTFSALNLIFAMSCQPVDVLRRQKGRLTGCGMTWFFALAAVAFALALMAFALATSFGACARATDTTSRSPTQQSRTELQLVSQSRVGHAE